MGIFEGFNASFNPNANYTSFHHGDLSIVIDFDEIKQQIAEEEAYSIGNPVWKPWVATLKDLEKIIIDLTQNHIDKLWDCIPLRKDGKFAKGQTILLHDSNVKMPEFSESYEAFNTLQIRLVPYFASMADMFQLNYVENSMKLSIGLFSNQILTPQVLDDNGIPRKVEKTKNTYLDPLDMVPGRVYLDAKQNKWLYIGVIVEMNELIKGTSALNMNGCYWIFAAYLKITKKMESLIKKHSDIQSLVKTIIENNYKKGDYLLNGISGCQEAKKMVSEDSYLYPVPADKVIFEYPADSFECKQKNLKSYIIEFQNKDVEKLFFNPIEVLLEADKASIKVVEKKFYKKQRVFPPKDNKTNTFIRSVMEKYGFKYIDQCTYELPENFSFCYLDAILRSNGIKMIRVFSIKKGV